MKGLGIMKITNKKGFTLIEVVLVLAIGGLIFLLAFLAFQNASVNRRDGQRRNDANTIVSELQNYASDHGGSIPAQGTAFENFVDTYMGDPFNGPSGKPYAIGTPAGPSGQFDSTFSYTPGPASNSGCDGSSTLGSKDFMIKMGLEKGEVCRDSL